MVRKRHAPLRTPPTSTPYDTSVIITIIIITSQNEPELNLWPTGSSTLLHATLCTLPLF